MSLPRYPEYKRSGERWLGVVPTHWQVERLRNLFDIRKRIAGDVGHQILSITQRGIKVKDVDSNDGQLSMDYSKYQLVFPGDFAMNHMDLLTGFVDISPFAGVTSPDYRVFCVRAGVNCDPRYFLYLLQNGYRQRIFYAFGQGASEFGRWRFPTDQFKDFRFPVPPLSEQLAIAAFLDRETAKIDALIAEQEKLIALLKEKRQTLISHAVTRGLDPDAPTKDSGVPWLGEVPAHWEVVEVRRVIRDHRQGFYSEDPYVDEGVKLLRITDIQDGAAFDYSSCPRVVDSAQADPFLVENGDFLFARTGGAGLFGVVENCFERVAYAAYLIRFRFNSRVETGFLRWFFLSNAAQQAITQKIHGGVNKNVHAEDIKSVLIAIPPIPEQREISKQLSRKLHDLEGLGDRLAEARSLLTERRSALIAAAVTGQIDVRGLVSKQEAA